MQRILHVYAEKEINEKFIFVKHNIVLDFNTYKFTYRSMYLRYENKCVIYVFWT